VSQLGFGATFQRMWNLYLAYSEGGFRAGYLDVHQLILERGQ
jgi:cyclopropane-fatty-acyl-phospholipid synthase